jgi:NAD dependent epimerase/dehydratase family enzyme
MEAKQHEKEYNKNYYANNKDKLLNTLKQKVICDCCGKSVAKYHFSRHKKTKLCQMAKNFGAIKVEALKLQIEEIKKNIAELETTV